MTSPAHQPRVGSGQLGATSAAKSAETRVKKPLYRRAWFRRTLLGLACVASLALAALLWLAGERHRERRAEENRQARTLDAFLQSDDFAAFARTADAQLLATLNFVVAQPIAARAAFPAVAAWEDAHRALPWALQLMPLPVSAAGDPARIATAGRAAAAQLARHGHVFDESVGTGGRQLFLRLLTPHVRAFLARSPDNGLDRLWLDRALQEQALAAFGARSGSLTPRSDAERLFGLYALLGPRMWETIDARQQLASAAPPAGL